MRAHWLPYIDVYGQTGMVGFEHDTLADAIVASDDAALEAFVGDHVMSAGDGVLGFLRSDCAKAAYQPAGKQTARAGS